MDLFRLPEKIQQANRLRQMAAILVKYKVVSTSKKLWMFNPFELFARLAGHARQIPQKQTQARLIRNIIEDLGTTFIKFGQWISVRPDFVPGEILTELEQLQDRIKPLPFKLIKTVVEEELGKPIDEVFAHFDQKPLSTASIAQVHRATLKDGKEVAVKVQRPGLKELIAVDTNILLLLVEWAVKNWPHLALHRLDEGVRNFRLTLMTEIDFNTEARNQDRMIQVFKDRPWLRIPRPYWQHTTHRLLVMEYLDGLKLGQMDRFEEWGLDIDRMANRLSDCMFRQAFDLGFFHLDPHPGNILFMRDSQIGLIDFGIVLNISDKMLDKFLDWFYAVIYRDIDLFERTFLDVGTPLEPLDPYQFRNDCMEYIDEHHFQPAERISFAKVFEKTNQILYKNKISTPSTFLFFFKALTTLEGVLRRLSPEFDWREVWGPKIRKIFAARYSPRKLARKNWAQLRDYHRLVEEYPEDFRQVVKRLKEGNYSMELSMSAKAESSLSGHVAQLVKAVNKLAFSMVLSALILGLFYLLRGQEVDFLPWLAETLRESWGILLIFVLIFIYFRRR